MSDENSNEVLRRWLDDEARVRQRAVRAGPVPLDEVGKTDGLGLFERILSGELPGAPIAKLLGFVPVECERGRIVFQGTPRLEHYNPMGTVHGGWIATLLDSAVACAVQSTCERGFASTTLELKVNYLRALTEAAGPVRAEGRVINVSRQIGVAEGRLFDSRGRMYGVATTTCMIFPLPPAG